MHIVHVAPLFQALETSAGISWVVAPATVGFKCMSAFMMVFTASLGCLAAE